MNNVNNNKQCAIFFDVKQWPIYDEEIRKDKDEKNKANNNGKVVDLWRYNDCALDRGLDKGLVCFAGSFLIEKLSPYFLKRF